jgi:glycosyl transferase family 25
MFYRQMRTVTRYIPTRVDAVDGRTIDRKSIKIDSYRSMKRGEIGCWMSHRRAWKKKFVPGSHLIVCEDDVVLPADFQNQVEQLKKTLPDDWEVASFGATDLWRRKYQNTVGKVSVASDDWLRVNGDCYGTQCYMIRDSVARRLLESDTMTAPIDVELSRKCVQYVTKINVAKQRKGVGSTTQRCG